MGNRAVIAYVPSGRELPTTYKDAIGQDIVGIYLHWNGGVESVQAFLDAAKNYGVSANDYGLARLTQLIGNFFGGAYSLGVGPVEELDVDNYDNGTYLVQDWEIKDRWFVPGEDEEFDQAYRDGVYESVVTANDRIFLVMSEPSTTAPEKLQLMADLLRKAASTDSGDEAAALVEKAQALAVKYGGTE